MNEQIKISIIIPMYNAEKYIIRCLSTLISLNIKNEIILINDGSTDNTLDIVRKFKKENSTKNIKIITQKNKGSSCARNIGIDAARGEYISFVDVDDMVDTVKYEKIINYTINDELDLGIGRYKLLMQKEDNENSFESRDSKLMEESLNEGLITGERYLYYERESITVNPWLKIYKRKFLVDNKLYFKPKRKNEDVIFHFETLVLAKKVKFYDLVFYYYFNRQPNSLTESYTIQNLYDYVQTASEIYELSKITKEEKTTKVLKNFTFYLVSGSVKLINTKFNKSSYYMLKKYKKLLLEMKDDSILLETLNGYQRFLLDIMNTKEILTYETKENNDDVSITTTPIKSVIYLKNGVDVYKNNIEVLVLNNKIDKIMINDKIEDYIIDTIKDENKKINIKTIDLKGKMLMPGVIDVHTHMREPGITEKEDFETGSRACAKGGITTFYDMPNTIPTTTTLENLIEKKKLASEKSIVNYGFHFGGSVNNNIDEIKKVLENKEGNTVKIFMNVTTGEMLIEDDKILEEVFQNSKLVLVHAENEMIDKAINLNEKYGKGLYICHISSKSEMEKVINGKKDKKLNNENHPIYAEVTPHHLFLNNNIRKKSEENKMLLRMKPELKEEVDNEFLWDAINNGDVDTIGTDHAPHLISEKLNKLTFGMPGVETSLALMIDAANKGKTSYEKVQKLMCENPSEIMKIEKRGKLEEGYFADLIAIDLEKKWTIGVDDKIETKCGWTPYKNWEVQGKNMLTIVNGNVIFKEDRILEDIPNGEEIKFYE